VPTYSYACTECDNRFDITQAFTDHSLTVCPVCSGALRKVFSSVGIVFKGSGFYRNDSRAGAERAKSENNSDGASKDGGPKESGSTKEGGSKDGGSKVGGSKDGGSKESGSKESGSKESTPKPTPKSGSAPASTNSSRTAARN
jgi:putative FmdB family regulatory protein